MISAWQKKSEETVAKKFGKELRKVIFLNPLSGQEEEFYLFGQRDWSIVLAVTDNNEVIVVDQYKQGCDKIIRELPAGTADFSKESPEETARRELLEETGYEAKHVYFLGPPQWMASRSSWTRFFSFLAVGCRKVQPAKIDLSEEIETELVPLERWIEMCVAEIEEPSSIVTTFRGISLLKKLGK